MNSTNRERREKTEKTIEIVKICVIACAIVFSSLGIAWTDSDISSGSAKVTITNYWQGDNAPYQNVTLTYHNHSTSFIVNCDFFEKLAETNVTYPVIYYSHPWPNISYSLPKGCQQQ